MVGIVITVIMPFGIIIYLALWILLPDRSLTTISDGRGSDGRGQRLSDVAERVVGACARYRSVAARMQRIEAYYTSNNTSLARQIEALMHDGPISEAAAIAAARAKMPGGAASFGRATR